MVEEGLGCVWQWQTSPHLQDTMWKDSWPTGNAKKPEQF
jgi:hypothetical protein